MHQLGQGINMAVGERSSTITSQVFEDEQSNTMLPKQCLSTVKHPWLVSFRVDFHHIDHRETMLSSERIQRRHIDLNLLVTSSLRNIEATYFVANIALLEQSLTNKAELERKKQNTLLA